MNRTPEQQAIIDHIKDPSSSVLTMVNAVAGSGKTTLILELAKELNPSNALYLAYNKKVATEAQVKFPTQVRCVTTHSLAYSPTVVSMKLSVGNFTYREVPGRLPYETKVLIVDIIREFCLSKYVDFTEYATHIKLSQALTKVVQDILQQMYSGKLGVTHDFYLKLFHILLSKGTIVYNEFDFIALDEAGDVNPVTLAIFNLLPARKKILIGDIAQNVYGFNHTINCFDHMCDDGTLLPMTQSFRVSNHIAKEIEKFCKLYISEDMSFKGIELKDNTISTRAFITRYNTSLIQKMIDLNQLKIPYSLSRTAKSIFELPLILIGLKAKGFVSNPSYKYLQDDADLWHSKDESCEGYKTFHHMLKSKYDQDIQLQSALNTIFKYGPGAIINCYEEARLHEKAKHAYTLGTAHSLKG